MTRSLRHLPDGALTDGAISEAAIATLRNQVWPAGIGDGDQAEAILAINEAVRRPDAAWIAYFVEAISAYLRETSHPRGTLSDDQADWLILALDRDGRIDSPAKLELLVHLVETFDATPLRMKAYILVQIERAVVFGSGPTRGCETTSPAGTITAQECELLRRVIFAPSGGGPARVSVEEAEMLFRIKDATLDSDNAREWPALFVQGVANYLRGWQGLAQPGPQQDDAHHRFVRTLNPGIGAHLGRIMRRTEFGRSLPVRHAVAETRADFLGAIGAAIDPLETALIAFLEQDARDIPDAGHGAALFFAGQASDNEHP